MNRLTRTVREQVALGRLLPLGQAGDAAWITESATVRLLRRATAAVPGVRLGHLSLALADPVGESAADVPAAAPVGALPHVPVRIEGAFEAAADEPLPLAADRLREALWDAAQDRVGLAVAAVDLRVTGLLDEPEAAEDGLTDPDTDAEPEPGADTADTADAADGDVAAAVRAVPGVDRLTSRLAGLGSGVRMHDTPASGPDAPGRRVQVQIAVSAGHSPLGVARAVTAAVASAAAKDAPGPVTSAVVVTDAG